MIVRGKRNIRTSWPSSTSPEQLTLCTESSYGISSWSLMHLSTSSASFMKEWLLGGPLQSIHFPVRIGVRPRSVCSTWQQVSVNTGNGEDVKKTAERCDEKCHHHQISHCYAVDVIIRFRWTIDTVVYCSTKHKIHIRPLTANLLAINTRKWLQLLKSSIQ